jgi:group I intron endonuclease
MASHRYSAKKNSRSIILLNSIKKYGWDAHKVEIIEEVTDDRLNEREVFWISELKTYCYENPNGCNMTKGGEGQRTTWMHDIERRKRQSERFKGAGGTFYGKHHTEENKKKASIRATEYNLRTGKKVPQWGAEKGWDAVRREVVCYNSKGELVGE